MASSHPNYEEMEQDLVSGYIKMELVINSNFQYPLELQKIIMAFMGHPLLIFDIFHEETDIYIQHDGKVVKYCHNTYSGYTFGSSYAINKGITFIDIQCIKPDTLDAIGIMTNIDECKKHLWIAHVTGYKYWWYNYIHQGLIYGEKDDKDIVEHGTTKDRWETDDILSLRVDCNEWFITFYRNEQEIYKMPLEKNQTYYLMLSTQSENFEYKIL